MNKIGTRGVLAGKAEHLRRAIQPGHPVAKGGQRPRHLPGTAAEVEDAGAGGKLPQHQLLQDGKDTRGEIITPVLVIDPGKRVIVRVDSH